MKQIVSKLVGKSGSAIGVGTVLFLTTGTCWWDPRATIVGLGLFLLTRA